ncbi:hypothetical protein BJX76DRAFT_363295 [Aspergillus varians]
MCTVWRDQEKKYQQEQVIQAGKVNNTNPWLQIIQWAKYLQGVDPSNLLDTRAGILSAGAVATANITTKEVVQVLQETMAQLVCKS